MSPTLYLDYNSTTPVDPTVLEQMLPYFSLQFGNAASHSHAFGWSAAAAVDKARAQVSSLINCEETEVIFTSGATESVNLSIKGVFEAYKSKGKHIVCLTTEHKAVIDSCKHLEKSGAVLTYLSVMSDGLIDVEELRSAIRPDTLLVCVMYANNETGVIQPIEKISQIVHEKGSLLFCDATQAFGKIRIDVNECGADLMCLSAHKMYGPKGVGALFVRRKNPRVTLIGQIDGGGHERKLRSGTLNVPGIVGLGAACELAGKNLWDDATRISILRTRLEQALTENDGASINGNIKSRIPNTTNICFRDIKAEQLIKLLPDIALATGSACSSALPEPSHVLLAMGLSEIEAYASIRISLGRSTTEKDVFFAAEKIISAVDQLRKENYSVK